METADQPVLAARDLGRRIDDGWIWRRLTLRLSAGERLGLAGPSGAGKSLLLRSIAGLDPIDEGRVELDGRPFEQWSPDAFRARVVYLHQRPALWEGPVEENLRRVFRLGAHGSASYSRDRAVAWLRELGRDPDLLERDAGDLSGGEAQIVALIRALQVEPRILLLDEPTASMDAAVTERAEELIQRWVESSDGPGDEDRRRSYIWSSHDAAQLERVTDRMHRLPIDDTLSPQLPMTDAPAEALAAEAPDERPASEAPEKRPAAEAPDDRPATEARTETTTDATG